MAEKDALALAGQVDEIFSMRGSKVVHLNLKKDKPDKATILAALLGPSGNLRAPAVRQGRRLFIGFSEALFSEELR